MVTKKSTRWQRFARRALLAGLAALVVALFDLRPLVGPPRAPAAAEAERARTAVRIARAALRDGKGTAWIVADNQDLRSAAVLASWLRSFGRFDAQVAAGTVVLQGSRALGPVWLNARAIVRPRPQGFPEVALTVGDVPFGPTLTRLMAEGLRGIFRLRGAKIPPLDQLVQSTRIDGDRIVARVRFPLDSGLADQLSGVRERQIDAAFTARLYCRLVVANRRDPVDDFATIVRRAFAPVESPLEPVERNRAAFVALAMYAVAPSAGRLAGDASKRVAACPSEHAPPRLAGRDDLAKHWALSAALASGLGGDIGMAMGEWKELADSRPGGSGFSLVDLAADRAGLAAAERATVADTAVASAARLARARENDLLPLRALALAEGMSEQAFVARYGEIDSAEFARVKARIDAILASNALR